MSTVDDEALPLKQISNRSQTRRTKKPKTHKKKYRNAFGDADGQRHAVDSLCKRRETRIFAFASTTVEHKSSQINTRLTGTAYMTVFGERQFGNANAQFRKITVCCSFASFSLPLAVVAVVVDVVVVVVVVDAAVVDDEEFRG